MALILTVVAAGLLSSIDFTRNSPGKRPPEKRRKVTEGEKLDWKKKQITCWFNCILNVNRKVLRIKEFYDLASISNLSSSPHVNLPSTSVFAYAENGLKNIFYSLNFNSNLASRSFCHLFLFLKCSCKKKYILKRSKVFFWDFLMFHCWWMHCVPF